MFHLEQVGLRASETIILESVGLDIPESGITVLVGPSGSGKSSLLRLLNRLSVPTEGTIRFDGTAIDGIDPRTLRRRVAMLFQRPTLLGSNGLEDLRVADTTLTEADAAALLERVHLNPALLHRETSALSGGEAQRLCTARALATHPDVVLADEPTSALDHEHAAGIEQLFRSLADDGMPVVWVTHDRQQVRRLADYAAVLDAGRLIAAGTPAELCTSDDPRVRSALGG